MGSDIDWQHELGRSFGDGDGDGEGQPAGHYVASGRRAVRRRRRAAALVVAASIAVAGTAAWAASPGPAPRGDAPVATQPAAVEQARKAQDAKKREKRLRSLAELSAAADARIDFGSGPASLTDRGLALAPQAGPVLQREPNPMGYTTAQGESIAIRVMFRGREHYFLMSRFGDDSSSSIFVAATGDFAGWLAHAVQTQRTLDVANGVTPSSGDTSDQPWLTLTSDGGITSTRPGIVLAEVRVDVDLGPTFAGRSDQTGAVRLLVDGRQEFAVYRVVDSALEVIPGAGSFDSLNDFLTWARAQYASGEGLR